MKLSEIHTSAGELSRLAGCAMLKGHNSLADKITLDTIEFDGLNSQFLGVSKEEEIQLIELENDFCRKFLEDFSNNTI